MNEKLENVDPNFNSKLEYAKAVISVYRLPDGCFETEPENTSTPVDNWQPNEYEYFRWRLLQRIDSEINSLDDKDAEGHIWWNKFKEMVVTLPE